MTNQTMTKSDILVTMEQALANYRGCFDATDYVLAWDNGLAVLGTQAVAVFNAEAVSKKIK